MPALATAAAYSQQLASKRRIACAAPFTAVSRPVPQSRQRSVQTVAFFGFGSAKFDDSKLYICTDCGYIYDGKEPISTVPNSYKCPICQSPKKRFKAYQGNIRGRPRNDMRSMNARFEAREW